MLYEYYYMSYVIHVCYILCVTLMSDCCGAKHYVILHSVDLDKSPGFRKNNNVIIYQYCLLGAIRNKE